MLLGVRKHTVPTRGSQVRDRCRPSITITKAVPIWIHFIIAMLKAFLSAGLLAAVDAHGALTFPRPRQSIDGDLAPWSSWSYPCDATHKGDACKINFCEHGHDCAGACPISAHNGAKGALNASNGSRSVLNQRSSRSELTPSPHPSQGSPATGFRMAARWVATPATAVRTMWATAAKSSCIRA